MDMMNFYNREEAEAALVSAKAAKLEYIKQETQIDKMIFLLEYYLATDTMLDPSVFDIEDFTEVEDDG